MGQGSCDLTLTNLEIEETEISQNCINRSKEGEVIIVM